MAFDSSLAPPSFVLPDVHPDSRNLGGALIYTDAENVYTWDGQRNWSTDTVKSDRKNTKGKTKETTEAHHQSKIITFHFLRTGFDTIAKIKKTKIYQLQALEQDIDLRKPNTRGKIEIQINGTNIESINDDTLPAKTTPDYFYHQIPKSMGMEFSHVEVQFHDVELEDEETGDCKLENHTFTSYMDTNGPVCLVNKSLFESYYTDTWQIIVTEELFYSAYNHARSLSNDQRNTFSMTDYICLNFLTTPIAPLVNCLCFTRTHTFSCARLALSILTALKLGNQSVYVSSYQNVDVLPDQVYAFIGRFAFINTHYRHVVCTSEHPAMTFSEDSQVEYLEQQLLDPDNMTLEEESDDPLLIVDTFVPSDTDDNEQDESVMTQLLTYLYHEDTGQHREKLRRQKSTKSELECVTAAYQQKWGDKLEKKASQPLCTAPEVITTTSTEQVRVTNDYLSIEDTNLKHIPNKINHKMQRSHMFLLPLNQYYISSKVGAINLIGNSFVPKNDDM